MKIPYCAIKVAEESISQLNKLQCKESMFIRVEAYDICFYHDKELGFCLDLEATILRAHENFVPIVKFKYKMNDKVWVMHNNKPLELTVKDAILTIPASEPLSLERKFYPRNPATIQYTLKWWCAAMRDPILVNEDQCFKTKEELLNSFK